jgi:hypothetical protein
MDRVAKLLAEQMVSRPEIEAIADKAADEAADKAVNRMMERLGLGDAGKVETFIENQLWVKSRRALYEAVLKQGITAVVAACLMAMFTAIGFWLKSGAPK